MVAYIYVMYSMGQMLQSAISESADSSQRRGLLFIHYGTVVIWSTFVVVWFGQELGVLSIYSAEMGNMLANFAAKVMIGLGDHAAVGEGRWCMLLLCRIELSAVPKAVHALSYKAALQGMHGVAVLASEAVLVFIDMSLIAKLISGVVQLTSAQYTMGTSFAFPQQSTFGHVQQE